MNDVEWWVIEGTGYNISWPQRRVLKLMDKSTLENVIKYRTNERMALLFKKGKDYASIDALSNFKRVGKAIDAFELQKLPSELFYCFVLILLKIDRWTNLIKQGKSPKNESLEDTIQDLLNYVELADAVYRDLTEDKLQ